MSDGVKVKRADFDKLIEGDISLGLGVLYETQLEMQEFLKKTIERMDKRFETGSQRFKKLENRKKLNTVASFGGGIIGGIIAIVGKNLFGIGR